MDKTAFWELIEESRQEGRFCEAQAAHLRARLAGLELAEVISFQQHFWARMAEAYRGDLWAVAYIVNSGCSDDGFCDFRGWLIAQGRAFFEEVLQVPERVGERVQESGEASCFDMVYVGEEVYRYRTGGRDMPGPAEPARLQGELFDEADLPRRYPELWRRFMRSAG
jgi:hypothetical protein